MHCQQLYLMYMIDFLLMLPVRLPVVDRINSENNKFATGVENNATGDSKLNDSLCI